MALSARVLVCEKGNRWAVALRRALGATESRIVETRSLAECWQELDRGPAALLALEMVSGNADAVIRRLLGLGRRFRHARAMVLAERELKSYEWVVREAGAVHVLFSVRDMPSATCLIRRYMQSAPQPALGLQEAVWRRLPWANDSTLSGNCVH